MLRNVLDIDLAAEKISVKSKAGAVVSFDLQAAFSSLSHENLWESLEAIGIPAAYVEAVNHSTSAINTR